MNTNLMRAAGLWPYAQQRITGKSLLDFVLTNSCTRGFVFAPNCLLFAVSWMMADGLIDHIAIPIRHARDNGQVFLNDLPRFELCGQRVVHLVVLGYDDHAAGI